ncbi:MAG: DUF5057 domain-containing protein [Evtepia sp.]
MKRFCKRIIAALLSCALIFTMSFSSFGADVFTSLPHIEEIISRDQPFDILEIADRGQFGYYVAGQEPGGNWKTMLAAKNNADARKAYMNTLKTTVKDFSSTGKEPAPLTWSDYKESYVWEPHGNTPLTLTNREQQNVRGTLTPSDQGDYQSLWSYQILDNGGYAQDIAYFTQTPPDDSSYYYYELTFEAVNKTAATDPDLPELEVGTAIYSKDTNGIYQYVGSVGSDLSLDIHVQYYKVKTVGRPHTDKTAYAAIPNTTGDGFLAQEGGYFTRNCSAYEYVGDQKGDYTFQFDPNSTNTVAIVYRTIYISGGYTNNNWFLKYVFDRTDDHLNNVTVRVHTVRPKDLTAQQIQDAEFIVISAAQHDDINPELAWELYNRGSKNSKIPFLIDASNIYAPTQLQRLNRMILSHAEGYDDMSLAAFQQALDPEDFEDLDFVKGNIYSFIPNKMTSILHSNFNQPYDDLRGFEAIQTEIDHENFLRQQQGLSKAQYLPNLTSMSTAIRYSINFANQRPDNVKESITVLELQPGRGHTLTPDMVKTWLDAEDDDAPTIQIVTMSTAEFIGKIENLNETYDMIYIGSSTEGFPLQKGKTTSDFNDDTMDGMLYSNIGDLFTSSILMAGLLERDFTDKTFSYQGQNYPYINRAEDSDANTFRFSGNDLTAAKSRELQEFAGAGYPIILADDLYTETAQLNQFDFSVAVTKHENTLTAEAKCPDHFPDLSLDYKYEWYDKAGTLCAREAKFKPSTSGTYHCELTISGSDIKKPIAARSNDWEVSSGNDILSLSDPEVFDFDTGNTIEQGSSISTDTRISARVNPSPELPGITYSYQWQRSKEKKWVDVEPPFKFSSSARSTSFRCLVRITSHDTSTPEIYSRTIDFKRRNLTSPPWQPYYTFNFSGESTNATITSTPFSKEVKNTAQPGSISLPTGASVLGPDPARIDNSSYLYEALNSIHEKSNVMNCTQATTSPTAVLRYVNLSKPELMFDAVPTPYKMDDKGATKLTPSGGSYALNYKFKIANKTDATPSATSYDCHLYIDLNSDGNYSAIEQVTDIILKSGDQLVTPDDGIYRLSADTDYTISRQMPEGYTGFIAWKLEVVKNGASNIHASQHGYTRIEPKTDSEKKKISILQINSSRTAGTVNLETQMQTKQQSIKNSICYSHTSGKNYAGIYGKLLADVKDFQVGIDTVTTKNLDGIGSISDYLNTYDMLIIGFDDMYQELSSNAAQAVVSYIATGKSVLFTHDTTSQVNLPMSDYQMDKQGSHEKMIFDDPAYWGYEFNKLLRDPVRLDRYGIRSKQRDLLVKQTDLTDLNPTEVKTLIDNHYSVAFQPGSARMETVAETQGYTNYALFRYGQDIGMNLPYGRKYTKSPFDDSGYNRETEYVSQINEGQITTYPYDVNTGLFDDQSDTTSPYMKVGLTHEQYYQINLNSDDIVVWYCMANSKDGNTPCPGVYSALPNDVTNAYYIYSKGNVTYSGAGHNNGSERYLADQNGYVGEQYVNEAKLFVNTMIAAYRTTTTAQTVSFTDSKDGLKTLPYLLLPSDAEQLLATTQSIFFKPVDANLGTKKTLSATFSYCTATDKTQIPLTIDTLKYAGNETDADCKELQGGLVYRFPIPKPVLDALLNSDSVTMTVTLTSTLNAESATAQIELHKIGLFDLT